MQIASANVDGVRMQWHEVGEGFPVVLVHGIPTGPSLWRHVAPRLRNARVLAWEMVGYAGSIAEGRDRDISVGRQADYLVAWLRSLGIERAVLAGHDLGGGVVHIAAIRHPDMCAGLFLTNAIGYDSWPVPSVKAMRAMGPLVKRLPPALFRMIFGSFLRRGHDDQRLATEAIRAHWPPYAKDGAAAFVRQVQSLDVHDTLAVSEQLRDLPPLPARVVWGVADQFQKVAYGERFARDLNTELTRIPGGKHFTPEDHPETIAAAINDLLTEVVEQGPIT